MLCILFQVLDARDPQGTRCYHLEKHLKENCKYKHMVFLLNKVRGILYWNFCVFNIWSLMLPYVTVAFLKL